MRSGISHSARITKFKPSMLKVGKHAGSQYMQGIILWLEVLPDNAPEYHVMTRTVIHVSEFSKLYKGMIVKVKTHPNDKNKVLISSW